MQCSGVDGGPVRRQRQVKGAKGAQDSLKQCLRPRKKMRRNKCIGGFGGVGVEGEGMGDAGGQVSIWGTLSQILVWGDGV
jgi:hypothetical protein